MARKISRRLFLGTNAVSLPGAEPRVIVPVQLVVNRRAKWSAEQWEHFRKQVWRQAIEDFRRGGIDLYIRERTEEIKRSTSGGPVFAGLDRAAINVVLTDVIPLRWDRGRGLIAVTTLYQGYRLCLIVLARAHAHQIPFFSVNTGVHEILHVLLLDVFENRPEGLEGERREWRVDSVATRLWLFGDGSAVRRRFLNGSRVP